ncbi:MAG: hypothetical protein ABSE08_17985 [Syntrophobacteraceae bacterium]
MSSRDVVPLIVSPSEDEKNPVMQLANRHGSALPRFRGLLLCRRCDFCGTRIDVHGEDKDSVTLQCPQCLRQYVFFQRPE